MRTILIALAILLAAACGQIPHPFEHGREQTTYPLAELTVDVRIVPVEGLPAQMAQTLTQAVTENMGGHGVTAIQRANTPSRFVLRGKAEPTGNPGETLLVGWTLYDADGVEAGLHVQELEIPQSGLESLAPDTIQGFGAATAKAIAALIGINSELPESATASPREDLFIEPVSGAPGNGNTALTAAIGRALQAADITVAKGPANARHILNGEVKVDPPVNGGQKVVIRWRVRRPGDGVIGEASQTNVVPAGSLDGRWGPIAGYAATAAIDGIQDILRRQRDRDTGPGIAVPVMPDLPPPSEQHPPTPSSETGS